VRLVDDLEAVCLRLLRSGPGDILNGFTVPLVTL